MVIGGEQLELREGQLAGCQHLGSSLLISKLLRMGGSQWRAGDWSLLRGLWESMGVTIDDCFNESPSCWLRQ